MIKNYRNIPYLNLIPIIFISLVLFKIVNTTEIIVEAFKYVYSLLSYLVWGFAIAYLLNPITVYLENRFKVNRAWSITITCIALLSGIIFTITILTPLVADNISQLSSSVPGYVDIAQKWVKNNIEDIQTMDKYNISSYFGDNLNSMVKNINSLLNFSFGYVFKKTLDITTMILKLVFGIIISMYLLNDKERLLVACKGILYAFIKESFVDDLLSIARRTHVTFSKYILGKILDSIILGIICILGLYILSSPYAILISLVIAITNLIPYIGALVGTVFCVVIILFISPIKALWVFIFLILVQQFDGWFLSPKIIGEKIGLSPLLILISIIIGGGVAGVGGMFFAIPIFAVMKELLMEIVEKRLKRKQLDAEVLHLQEE